MRKGRLVLVVGPSGVGKDSILSGVQQRATNRPDIVFPRRVITRDAVPGTEDHDTLSVERFEAEQARGAFALSWTAHGLHYGIPVSVENDIEEGRLVLVNVSRTILQLSRNKYPSTRIIQITASQETLRNRLSGRGRETADEVAARLARAVDVVSGDDVRTISNDDSLDEAIDRFLAILDEIGNG